MSKTWQLISNYLRSARSGSAFCWKLVYPDSVVLGETLDWLEAVSQEP